MMVVFISGLGSLLLKRANPSFMPVIQAFSGSVFLSIVFLFLLPSVSNNFDVLQRQLAIPFPLGHFCVLLGYLIMLVLNKVLLGKARHKQRASLSVSESPSDTNEVSKLIEKPSLSMLPNVAMFIAFAFHAVLEGMVIGIQSTPSQVITLWIGAIAHKWAGVLGLGIMLQKNQVGTLTHLLFVSAYAMINPSGILLGMVLLQTFSKAVDAALTGVAIGTIIYVAASDILVDSFSDHCMARTKYGMVLLGVAVISTTRLVV